MPEHIVRKDGKKYVAYVNGFLRTYVYYYDYKNIFVVGNQKRIEEDYGKGGFDPIENKFGNKYDVEMTTYYDEDGNVVSRENTKSDNQIQETEIENITNNIEETYNGIITNINSNSIVFEDKSRNKKYSIDVNSSLNFINGRKNEKVFATRELETEEMTSLYKTEQEARDNYTSYNGSYSETTFKIYLSNCNGIAHNENECVETSDGSKFYPAGRSDGDGMISVKELVIF